MGAFEVDSAVVAPEPSSLGLMALALGAQRPVQRETETKPSESRMVRARARDRPPSL
jgi:hypothetical protein